MRQHIDKIFGVIIVVLLIVLSQCADAATNSLEFGCCSYHFNRDAGYNEFNYGVMYHRHYNEKETFYVGMYKNSEHTNTFAIGGDYTWKLSENFDFKLRYGVLTGYVRSPLIPFVLPVITYKDTVNLYAFPVDEGGFAMSFTLIKW